MNLNAQIFAKSIISSLPENSSIKSEFQILVENGKLLNFINESRLDISGENHFKESVLKNTEELSELIQKALNFIGFYGKIYVQVRGSDIMSVRSTRITGMEQLYCSLCVHAQNDCVECDATLDQAWNF